MKVLQIIATGLVWVCFYIPLILVSFVAVPVMLARGWEGYTTWFGNYRYGKAGNKAYPATNVFKSWWFLCVRNPISNFGKLTMSVSSTATWPWFHDVQLFKALWLKAGWKPVVDPVKNPERTFLFRPYFKWGKDEPEKVTE